jgi:methanogenic corrinoid protein MtbC1
MLSDKSGDAESSPREAVITKVLQAVLTQGQFVGERLLEDLTEARVGRNEIVDSYIPACAKALGDLWDDDKIGFAQVTIAVSRLQSLLTIVAPPWNHDDRTGREAPNVMLLMLEGDTHTLGPHIATAQLRRLGASVQVRFGPTTEDLIDLLRYDRYDLMLFSCSRMQGLETIGKLVKRVRQEFDSVPPIVLGGSILNHTDHVKDITDVDLVTSDVKVAYRLCEKLRQMHKAAAQ